MPREIDREARVVNKVFVQTVVLSDGSEVHDMRLDHMFLAHFPTENDLVMFETGLRDLFEKYTLDSLIVRRDEPVRG